MDAETLQGIAREAQHVARLLSPYQNLGDVETPAPPAVEAWRRVVVRPLRRLTAYLFGWGHPERLTTRDVTRITNALLNAGNALEYVLRGQTEEKTCPNSEPAQTSTTPDSSPPSCGT